MASNTGKLVAVLALCALVSSSQAKVTVTVFYETLCPDSIRFIVTQLTPTFVQLGGFGNAFLDIDFVPYGKALTFENEDGDFTFQCQHGPNECEGNRVHSCALKYLPEARRAAFINCSMSSPYPPTAGKNCSELLGLDFSGVESCLSGSEGGRLLAANGNRTHSLEPTLYYVPWILFDGVFNPDDLYDAQQDFLEILCRKLGTNQPTDCPQATSVKSTGSMVSSPKLNAVKTDPARSNGDAAVPGALHLMKMGMPSVVATLLNARR